MALTEEKQRAFVHLKSQNWYKYFTANYGKGNTSDYTRVSYPKFLEDNPIDSWITRSMEWDCTPQGHRYWYLIHREWQRQYSRV